ncbi:MAG: DNA polymerase IV [Fibrobacteria bacterium]|nr:DNA polymerase IV [Fibrobacteria bacterium]
MTKKPHKKIIFHVDMDAFYASVEQRDNPEYRGRPVIVGAMPGSRGVVSAASYEARKFGVHSAMPISHAYERCPKGIFLKPGMGRYVEESRKIMEIFNSFTPVVEQISVDEAFLDITGTDKLWGTPLETAEKIRTKIKEDRGLTASVGIAPNKFLAKVASDMNKPDGVTVVPFDKEAIINWLSPLPVGKIWGIGKQSQAMLAERKIFKVGDLQQLHQSELESIFGQHGRGLYWLSRGMDNRSVGGGEPVKSISREYTFNQDTSDMERWKKVLLSLSSDVARRARKQNYRGHTVVFTYRTSDFKRYSRRTKIERPTFVTAKIYETVLRLMDESFVAGRKLRLIGVGITDLDGEIQGDLLDTLDGVATQENSEFAVDKITGKFGKDAIRFGTELDKGEDKPKDF